MFSLERSFCFFLAFWHLCFVVLRSWFNQRRFITYYVFFIINWFWELSGMSLFTLRNIKKRDMIKIIYKSLFLFFVVSLILYKNNLSRSTVTIAEERKWILAHCLVWHRYIAFNGGYYFYFYCFERESVCVHVCMSREGEGKR